MNRYDFLVRHIARTCPFCHRVEGAECILDHYIDIGSDTVPICRECYAEAVKDAVEKQ